MTSNPTLSAAYSGPRHPQRQEGANAQCSWPAAQACVDGHHCKDCVLLGCPVEEERAEEEGEQDQAGHDNDGARNQAENNIGLMSSL